MAKKPCYISTSPNDFIPREMCLQCKERTVEITVIPVHRIEVNGLEVEIHFAEIGQCRKCKVKSLSPREERRWNQLIEQAQRRRARNDQSR